MGVKGKLNEVVSIYSRNDEFGYVLTKRHMQKKELRMISTKKLKYLINMPKNYRNELLLQKHNNFHKSVYTLLLSWYVIPIGNPEHRLRSPDKAIPEGS